MSRLPPEVLKVIEGYVGLWSNHAIEEMVAHGLAWEDVQEVARTSLTWKRERDERGEAVDGYKDAVTGRDTHGRRMYLAGKRVYLDGEVRWYVITFHEAQ